MVGIIHPIINGKFIIPTRLLAGRVDLSSIERDLTTEYYNPETGVTQPVRAYSYRQFRKYVCVPREYGRITFPDLWERALDRTVKPRRSSGSYPCRIKPRDAQQAAFMRDIAEHFSKIFENVFNTQIKAQTGTGKTVAFIKTMADLEIAPVLVVVHSNRLKAQWVGSVELEKGLAFFFGKKWVRKNVGIVQQGRCDFRGKKFVIAMGPSLASRKYSDEFYRYFGVVCIDEIHKFATPTLNQIIGLFPASVHLSMTATPKQGSMGKLINSYIGSPKIVSTQEAMQPIVYRIPFVERVRFWSYTGEPPDSARLLKNPLSRLRVRNEFLARLIYFEGFEKGRQCLGLSDRTEQILWIRNRLVELGVPEEEIGVYVGSYRTGKIKLTGSARHDDGATIHFRGLAGFDSRADATSYARQTAYDRNPNGVWTYELKFSEEMYKPTNEEYEHMENHCSIILATYGIFDTGIDIKRLDMGVELLPRGDVVQALGRIMRMLKGKLTPVWFTIADILVQEMQRDHFGTTRTERYQYKTPETLEQQRIISYRKQNAILKQRSKLREALQNKVA